MTTCPNCQAEVAGASVFCAQCGHRLQQPDLEAGASTPPAPEAFDDGDSGDSWDDSSRRDPDEPHTAVAPTVPAESESESEPAPAPDRTAVAVKPLRGRRLTLVAKTGLLAALVIALVNPVMAAIDIFDGGGFSDIDDWFSMMSDTLPIVSTSMLVQVFLGLLAAVLCFFRRAWIHPLVFIVVLVGAQVARGVPGSDVVWDDTIWANPDTLQDFNASSQIWFWLPSMMVAAMLIYWLGWKLGKPKPKPKAKPRPDPEPTEPTPTPS